MNPKYKNGYFWIWVFKSVVWDHIIYVVTVPVYRCCSFPKCYFLTIDPHIKWSCSRDARCTELEEQVERLDWERDCSARAQQEAERRCAALKSELKVSGESLTKAHLCIQGFVKENQRLNDLLEQRLHSNLDTCSVGVATETEPVATVESSSAATNAVLIRAGVDRARNKFLPALTSYRRRYERTWSCLAASRRTCDLLRHRMEELADFLQQLLDSWDANETLNLSSLRHVVKT